jgi:DNA cross-link repair 1C protein
MSTFNGEIENIPEISIDFFEREAVFYFVSHCHTDHLKGITNCSPNATIYATSQSAFFIKRKCPHLEHCIKILTLGIPTIYDEQKSHQVTALPAGLYATNTCENNFQDVHMISGHCMGSCMLLFELKSENILYTGDFRVSLKDVKNIKILDEIRKHDNVVLYVDSTFMKREFSKFPSQTESVTTIVQMIKNFLNKSKNNKGNLFCTVIRSS